MQEKSLARSTTSSQHRSRLQHYRPKLPTSPISNLQWYGELVMLAAENTLSPELLGIAPGQLQVRRSMALGPVRGSKAAGAMGEAPHWLLPVPRKAALWAHAPAATRVPQPCSLLCLQWVVQAGWRGHVFQVRERLEDLHNLAHQRPGLGIPGEAGTGQLGHLVSAFHGDVTAKFRIHQGLESLFLFQMGPGPFHKVVLPCWSVLVHRSPACHELQQHHPEAIHVALRRQVTYKWKLLKQYIK